ncbi:MULTISPECIES: hypothetical protein [Pseudovibrio]|uniref:hypothetical protein n=1 Tax=Stappiaceae TaxID=2821832 RepID=UPI00236683C7|nr:MULTISPECIES: hypothetical protein [Pseudovibrio]MDD7911090.1 hypothetical protein [Pseudovibrio exalbescens]MDX5595703.1 hypothetical protein [Pseudovibrio sp. SPO723]
MNEEKQPKTADPDGLEKKQSEKDARAERLAAALRDNLKRRKKAQKTGRSSEN